MVSLGLKWLSLLSTIAVCLCRSSSLNTSPEGAVNLMYQKENLIGIEGQSLRFICAAEYDIKLCGHINAYWCHHSSENCTKLTDPRKYLTVVNETFQGGSNIKLRLVDIEFTQLTSADQGQYQCRAECEIGGHSAFGHFKTVTVNAAPTVKSEANSGPNWTYKTGLMLFTFVILELLEDSS